MKYIRPLSQTSFINDANLLAYWTLDGNANDYKNVYNGTSNNVVYGGDYAKFGQGASFNGTSGYITYGDVLDMGTSDWTASFWMKINGLGSGITSPFSKSSARAYAGRWGFYFDTADSKFGIVLEGTSSNVYNARYSYSSLNDGNWHFITGTFNRSGNAYLYIDGVQVTGTTISGANGQNLNSTDPLYIGAYGNSTGTAPSYFFNGYVDDVAVFNRALTAAEVSNLYAGESFINNRPLSQTRFSGDTSLVSYWKLDGNSNDSKGSNNGTDTAVTYGIQYGVFNQGASFNGTSSRIQCPSTSSLNITTAMTISLWIYPIMLPTSGNIMSLVSKYDADANSGGYDVRIRNDAGIYKIGITAINGTQYFDNDSIYTPPLNSWTNVIFIIDGSSYKTYINGVLLVSIASTILPAANNKLLNIGNFGYFTTSGSELGRYFNGYMDDIAIFRRALNAAEVSELYEKDILFEELKVDIGKDMDIFDLICHIAYDKPPLTRKERANRVQKRDYFNKYEGKAKEILKALLEKYSDEGIETIETIEVLKLPEFSSFGTAIEIVNTFGGRDKYLEAIKDLENEIYKGVA